jgi:hypothetical protein
MRTTRQDPCQKTQTHNDGNTRIAAARIEAGTAGGGGATCSLLPLRAGPPGSTGLAGLLRSAEF